MADAPPIDELVNEVRQRLVALGPLPRIVDSVADRIPDLEAEYPGAADAARSVAEMTTGVLSGMPSPEELAQLMRSFANEIAPPVDAKAFRDELELVVPALISAAESLSETLPGLPPMDLRGLADRVGEGVERIPDQILGQIGGLLREVDLRELARLAGDLSGLAVEPLPEGADDSARMAIIAVHNRALAIRAKLQIASAIFNWLRDTFPFELSADCFVVADVDISALGLTAKVLSPLQTYADLLILMATFLISLLETKLESEE